MREFYVRNVPKEMHARLKVMARENKRTLNAEVLALLEEEVEFERREKNARAYMDAVKRVLKGTPSGAEEP